MKAIITQKNDHQSNKRCALKGKGQTFMEYTTMITLILGVLVVITPVVRRVTQGMVKVVADQVGNQRESYQHGGVTGHLISSSTSHTRDEDTRKREWLGEVSYDTVYLDSATRTLEVSNQGYTPGPARDEQ